MSSQRFRELRLVAPVVTAVCVILVAAIYFETYFERLRGGADRNRSGSWMLWSQYWILSTSAAGIWMAGVWSSLYGKKALVRLAAAVFTIAVVTALGWKTAILLDAGVFFKRDFEVLGSLVAAGGGFFVICVLPLLAMRWFRAWRVLHEEDASAMPASGRYPLKSIFYLTTATAVFCAVLIWVADILRVADRGKGLVTFLFCILPSIGGVLLLKAMSRMRIRFVWPTACLLGLFVAGAIAFGLKFSAGARFGTQRIIDEAFMPTLVGFLYASLLILLTAWWLRSQGVLIRCGGSSGFDAIRDRIVPFPSRAVAVAITCALLIEVSIGAWVYYLHWELIHAAIPSQPSVADLPRLMRLASHKMTVAEGQDRETRIKINERRQEATDAIVSLGDQAIPFLLERLTEKPDGPQFEKLFVAGQLLSKIGAQNSFGEYKDRVITTIIGNQQAFSNGQFALTKLGADAVPTLVELLEAHDYHTSYSALVLERIGLPHAAPAILALKRASLADSPSDAVLRALVVLAGSDALPTLLEILENHEKYPVDRRVAAASAIGKLGAEGAAALPMIEGLLSEVNITPKVGASSKVSSHKTEYLQTRIVECVGNLGLAAKSVAPQLMQFLESLDPSKTDNRLRESLIWSLGRLRATEFINRLELLVQDPTEDARVRTIAVAALGEIGPPAVGAIETIDVFLAASHINPRDELTAAEVAKARILMAQRESLTRSLLNRIDQPADAPSAVGGVIDEDASQQMAILCALVWLGAAEDEQIMRHTAALSFNGDHQKLSLHFHANQALGVFPMSQWLWSVFIGISDPALFDNRWTTDGKVRSLLNSLEVGLQAEDATTRLAASGLLASMGSLSLPVAPALHNCLKDEDPRVRLRAAIALMLADEESEEVYSALRDKDETDWGGMPLTLRQLIESRVAEPVSK